MITICIPIYNFNVTPLINELSQQAKRVNVPYEIILIDDCSSEEFKQINEQACKKEVYIQLDKNIGRAKIRNLFLKYAKYDNLLFLDCDALIISKDFVSKYIESIRQNKYSIICGGRIYDNTRPGRNQMLRWKYGIKKESQPYNIRILSPNKSFMTNNFLINRKIFEQIQFDERITEYGHEDTLFGYMLKKKGIGITHIDNPVLNGDIENNAEYLGKTEKGIINLIYILSYVDHDNDFIRDVTILNFYKKINAKKLTSLIHVVFICFKPLLKFLN
jgi:glycosyltransferase involved in cell wall biosynthesis